MEAVAVIYVAGAVRATAQVYIERVFLRTVLD
jgi:hypothetical protein